MGNVYCLKKDVGLVVVFVWCDISGGDFCFCKE